MAQYTVHVWPEPWKDIKSLPGKVRQRVRQAIDKLAEDPRPSKSKVLELPDDVNNDYELLRLRLENWRVIYVINAVDKTVDVLAVHKRPPYNYEDVTKLLERYSPSDEE